MAALNRDGGAGTVAGVAVMRAGTEEGNVGLSPSWRHRAYSRMSEVSSKFPHRFFTRRAQSACVRPVGNGKLTSHIDVISSISSGFDLSDVDRQMVANARNLFSFLSESSH